MASRVWLVLGWWVVSVSAAAGADHHIGIPFSKATTLVFPEEIVEVSMSSRDYAAQIKGRYLLVRAKSQHVPPSSLFVSYGKQRHCFVAEIFVQDSAPLAQSIPGYASAEKEEKEEAAEAIFAAAQKQEYFSLGAIQGHVHVILTNILHKGDHTYLRLYIDNRSSLDFALASWSFEYVGFSGSFLFKKKTTKPIEALYAPLAARIVQAGTGCYVVFGLPSLASQGGLAIFLAEARGERNFKVFVPSRVLLKAKRVAATK